ncbi:MAG: hypothetical protein V2A65_02245 [Candidatus Omnitrophota bacterium]
MPKRKEGENITSGNSLIAYRINRGTGFLTGLFNRKTRTRFLTPSGRFGLSLDWEFTDPACRNLPFPEKRKKDNAREGIPYIGDIPGFKSVSFQADTVGVARQTADTGTALLVTASNDIFKITTGYGLENGGDRLRISLTIKNLTAKNILLNTLDYVLESVRLGAEWTDEYLLPTLGNSIVFTNDYVKNFREQCNKDDPRAGLHLSVSPCGLNMPYLMLYDGVKEEGLVVSEWLNKSRPGFFLKKNSADETASLGVQMFVSRVLWPGEAFHLGEIDVRLFQGSKYKAMESFGKRLVNDRKISVPEDIPQDCRRLISAGLPITDFSSRTGMLKDLKKIGVNAVYIAGHWRSGVFGSRLKCMQNPCVIMPYDGLYTPEPRLGGVRGQKKFLGAAHKLGMKVLCWITMSGISFEAEEVNAHPDWWIHDRQEWTEPQKWGGFPAGERRMLERKIKDHTLNRDYKEICGGNPLSPGWRRFFIDNIRSFVKAGYDGVFLDCLVHKSPDYASYPWYGETQDAEIDQMRELREDIRKIAPDFIFVGETFGFQSQRYVDICFETHHPMRPSRPLREDDSPELKNRYWTSRNFPKIGADKVQDYMRIQHLSKLPGARLLDYMICYGSNLPAGAEDGDKDESFAWMYACFSRDNNPLVSYGWKPYQTEGENEKPFSAREKSFWNEVRRMSRIRLTNRELTEGSMVFDAVHAGPAGVVHFARYFKPERTVILVNFNPHPVRAKVRFTNMKLLGMSPGRSYCLQDLLGQQRFPGVVSGRELSEGIAVSLPGYRAILLKIKERNQ